MLDVNDIQHDNEPNSDDGYQSNTVKNQIFDTLYHHHLPADERRNLPFNLESLRKRKLLLLDLKEKDNLLYEGKNWAVSTTIGPYGNHHIMLIYTGISEDICHIGQISDFEMTEYYDILTTLLEGLEKKYSSRLETGELNFYFGLNHSLNPGRGKSQSVFRPHTHIVFIDNKPKEDGNHIVTKIPLYEEGKSNKGKLALNKQNLSMIRDFERNFLDINLQKYNESLIVTGDEFYAIDFELPGNLLNLETIKIFEKIHSEGREFLEAIGNKDTNLISDETFKALGDEIDKIGYSMGFYKKEGTWHLRFRFSFKNKGENAGMLEALGHAIHRDDNLGSSLPDMSEIREYVKTILQE